MTIYISIVAYTSLALGLWLAICTICNILHFKQINKHRHIFSETDQPLVSVVIPARNEENTLPRLLDSLIHQTYRNLEVLVINDSSTDKTEEVLKDFVKKDERIHYYNADPNVHYIKHGKMNALLQIIPKAKGDYLITTDADTWENETCIETILSIMMGNNLDILSGFPSQYSPSNFARLIITCMIFSTAVLPHFIINRLQWSRFAMGIGQFIIMKKKSYDEVGGYMNMDGEVCDDLAIIKRFMRNGKKYYFTKISDQVSCTMYENPKEAIHGLERSICSVFPSAVWSFVVVVFIALCLLAIFLSPLLLPFTIYFGMMRETVILIIGYLLSKVFWYIACRNINVKKRTAILSSSSVTMICFMYLHGMWIKTSGRNFYWKGRKV